MCDPKVHCAQTSKYAGERTILALKPKGLVTQKVKLICGPTEWTLAQQNILENCFNLEDQSEI